MLVPAAVVEEMDGIVDWWAVAGGWAIDLWLNTESREHHDIEVVVRRCDQRIVQSALSAAWTLWCLDPPGSGWRPWENEPIEAPAFQLQARSRRGEFDLFAETVDDTTWTFRRDTRIQRPAEQIITTTEAGIPVVCPEVQLLYMAASLEPKNQHDFDLVRRHLRERDAAWLVGVLAVTQPRHRWITALTGQG